MKFSNRKKLAMIMTLASVLSNKTSGINKSKTSQNLETVGEKVIGDLKSSGNFSKSGIDKNKSSQNLETVGEKVIGDLKSSGNFSKLGTEKTVLSNNENIINNKSLDNNSKRLSERAMYGILAASGAGIAGLGALAYYVAGLLFGNHNTKPTPKPFFDDLSRSKQFVIELLKNRGVRSVTFNTGLHRANFYNLNNAPIYPNTNNVEVAKWVNPGANGKELLDASFASWGGISFYNAYDYYFFVSIKKIALKHGLNLGLGGKILELVNNPDKCNINIAVELNKELSIKILDRNTKQDITQEYNKDNPETDLDKRRKEFYDDLVKFINNDDFVRKIFFDSRNEVNPVVDPFLDNMSRSKQFAIQLLKNVGADAFSINQLGMINFHRSVNKKDGLVDGMGRLILDNVVKTAKSVNPGISGEKLLAASLDIDKFWPQFYGYHQEYCVINVSKIALKHGFNFLVYEDMSRLAENLAKCDIYNILVEFKNKKLSVKIFKIVNRQIIDITQEYNKDNPETDLDKRKKGFYDDLVKFINNDDFIKKLFLE